MSKREITLRHTAIINKLRKGPATLKEINQYLSRESELVDYNLLVSNRTFQRDRQDILSIYNIGIECNKAKNEYYILDREDNTLGNRMLDAFNTINALNSSLGLQEYLEFEHYADSGAEHFHGLLHGVKNCFEIRIYYKSYWDQEPLPRDIHPYFLKEFKNRWYLIALDIHRQHIRTYALDRIIELEISRKKFNRGPAVKSRSYFQHSFGIIGGDEDKVPEPVVLSFSPFQGQYIKSLPLHPHQKILRDDETEFLVELNVHSTFDLEMQILSYGEHVKVIAPEHLKETIMERLNATSSLYSH